MKKEDLSIGNYTEQGVILELRESCARVAYKVEGKERTSLIEYENIVPISLTEEVALNMFEFTKDLNNDICKDINDFVFLHYYDGKVVLLDEEHNNTILTMNYVHEAQNLWWSFTREELIKTK